MKKVLFLGLIIIAIVSCKKIINPYKYNTGSFSELPVNFEEINTIYDDYNSTAPSLGETFPLCFSSNRNSKGANYDIVYKLITISYSKSDGSLKVFNNNSAFQDVVIENENISNGTFKINTAYDELGPYLIPQGINFNGSTMTNRFETYIFLYSNNEEGNHNIMFTENLNNEFYEAPIKVNFLNSEFDDAYPTFNNDFSEIYFTSNRESVFNIYKVITDNTLEIVEMLQDSVGGAIEKVTILSSAFDDKCPYIINNTMVFASNREGGFGGFDLYFSVYENGNWSSPQNFGSKINSEYDEYRPIVRPQESFSNDFMLFSSNRPGGKGGFDLYYVGITKFQSAIN